MANPLMGLMQKAVSSTGGGNPMMGMIMQMMGGGKPNINMMMQQIMQSNPQAKQMWQQVQQMTDGKSETEIKKMVEEMASKNGITTEQLQQIANKFKS